MFEHWDSFYLLVGGASGGLIGLVFIVVTLLRGGDARDRLRGASIYMSPIVFNLTAALVLSAIATAPTLPVALTGGLIGASALVGLISSGRVLVMLGVGRVIQPAHWTDIWAYGVIPTFAYLVVAAASAAVWLMPDWASLMLATSLIGLLVSSIRNAWDLVTWITAKGSQLDKG